MQTIHTILVVHPIKMNVCGQTFNGTATSANAMVVGQNNRTASTSATNDTVAVRDSPGNLAANLFQGTATEASYADLAEKYTTDDSIQQVQL